MDIKIKLYCQPQRLSAPTLTGLLSHLTKYLEQSVFKTMCDLNKGVSHNKLQKCINNNIHIDVDRVEKGSFILFLSGALAATVASCVYDVVKKKLLRRLSYEDVKKALERYEQPIMENIAKDLKNKKRFGSLYVDDVKTSISNNAGIITLNIDLDFSMPDKEHMPISTHEQIQFYAEQKNLELTKKED